MYLITIFLPLLNYIVCSFFSRFLGRQFVYILSVMLLTTSFFLSSCILFFLIKFNIITEILLFQWSIFSGFSFSFSFLFDSISCIMLFVVTSVSCLVHIYSGIYMEHDPQLPRFLSYLSLFTFFMLFYVTGANFIQLFLGWEGIGLCSYLLINFWYTRVEANKAALKAVIVNKIGDCGFFFGIILCGLFFKSVDFSVLQMLVPLVASKYTISFLVFGFHFSVDLVSCICTFFVIGVIGKSAQIGLHTWLPDAMEGPTPVSALIHAATMVTAGVFLIIRASFFFLQSPILLNFLIILGSITAFFSGTIALFQYDIKKVIAYSTCSQLGYMVLVCGLGGFDLALFHLFNHAFFKALLFLSSGIIIHSFNDEQDIRRYGGLLKVMPFIFYTMLIGSLSLMGFPYLSGFYSKDKILEFLYYTDTPLSFIGYVLGLLGVFLTAMYSSRLLYLVFFVALDRKVYYFSGKSFYNLEHVRIYSSKLFFIEHFSNHFAKFFFSEKKNFSKNYGVQFKNDIDFLSYFDSFSFIGFFFLFKLRINAKIFTFFNIIFLVDSFLNLIFYSVFFCGGAIIHFFKRIWNVNLIFVKNFMIFLYQLFYFEYLILFPLVCLLFGSIFSGYIFFDLFLGAGSSFFSGSLVSKFDLVGVELLLSNPKNISVLPLYLKLLPFFFSTLGFLLIPFFYHCLNQFFFTKFFFFRVLVSVVNFFNKKWFIDNVYNYFLNKIFNYLFSAYIAIDKAFLEFINIGFAFKIILGGNRLIKGYQVRGVLSFLIKKVIFGFLFFFFFFFFFNFFFFYFFFFFNFFFFFFFFFLRLRRSFSFLVSQKKLLINSKKGLPFTFNFNYNFFFLKKRPSILFLSVDLLLSGWVYNYSAQLHQASYTGRWLPGKYTNRHILMQQLYNHGLLDNRLLLDTPSIIFILGPNCTQAFFEIKKTITALIFGFVPVNFFFNMFDVVFPINAKNCFSIVYIFEILRPILKKLINL